MQLVFFENTMFVGINFKEKKKNIKENRKYFFQTPKRHIQAYRIEKLEQITESA